MSFKVSQLQYSAKSHIMLDHFCLHPFELHFLDRCVKELYTKLQFGLFIFPEIFQPVVVINQAVLYLVDKESWLDEMDT